jgi:hypothetical protein
MPNEHQNGRKNACSIGRRRPFKGIFVDMGVKGEDWFENFALERPTIRVSP